MNYKPYGYNQINFGPITTSVSNSTIIKFIYVNSPLTAATACKDLADLADYQVPSGKTFKILGIKLYTTAAFGRITINQGDTAAAETVLKADFAVGAHEGNYSIPLDISIASEKYLTFKSTVAVIYTAWIIGFEE